MELEKKVEKLEKKIGSIDKTLFITSLIIIVGFASIIIMIRGLQSMIQTMT